LICSPKTGPGAEAAVILSFNDASVSSAWALLDDSSNAVNCHVALRSPRWRWKRGRAPAQSEAPRPDGAKLAAVGPAYRQELETAHARIAQLETEVALLRRAVAPGVAAQLRDHAKLLEQYRGSRRLVVPAALVLTAASLVAAAIVAPASSTAAIAFAAGALVYIPASVLVARFAGRRFRMRIADNARVIATAGRSEAQTLQNQEATPTTIAAGGAGDAL
jgi:hypothetical protein